MVSVESYIFSQLYSLCPLVPNPQHLDQGQCWKLLTELLMFTLIYLLNCKTQIVESQTHKSIECLRLQGISGNHLVQPLLKQSHLWEAAFDHI